MLTPEDIQRIREEELLRNEIRNTLVPRQNPVWAFFNSALGLWVLGTIVVGFLTWSYSEWRADTKIADERWMSHQRIRAEVLARLDAAGYFVNVSAYHEPKIYDFDDLHAALTGASTLGIYPEYAHRNLSSLIVQLREAGRCDSAGIDLAVVQARTFEYEFAKWRRRSTPKTDAEWADYIPGRRALDSRFSRELKVLGRLVATNCQ